MFVDIGASNKDEAEAMGVRIGDAIVPDSSFYSITKKAFKDGKPNGERTLIFGKAFDNRISTFLATEVIRALKERKIAHPNKVVGAATVQEEVGLRGARTAANYVKPDLAIILDVDIAGDVPGIEVQQAPAKMGEGVAVITFDASMIPNQPLKELVIDVCEKNKIPYQLAAVAAGGTDGGQIHLANIGIPSIVVSVPTRHIHSHVGVIDMADVENGLRLVIELLKVLDRKTVDSLTAIEAVGPFLTSFPTKNYKNDELMTQNAKYTALVKFMSDIIKANNLALPLLPDYQKYGYDEKEHKLVILEYPALKNPAPAP
jgi:endoglucanase